jgi:aerobic-type carbon monoxide dehydrogenase small subunit (CoxS/CutS family)
MAVFFLNGKEITVDAAGDTPLLWVIRDTLKATGTKFGCGIGLCGRNRYQKALELTGIPRTPERKHK